MRIWFDDIRRAPDGWVWARTVEQAKEKFKMAAILREVVTHISLDHDLGLDYVDVDVYEGRPEELWILAGTGEETGQDLVKWMIETNNLPANISIHSWNPDGAKRMAKFLNDVGVNCMIKPFDPKEIYD